MPPHSVRPLAALLPRAGVPAYRTVTTYYHVAPTSPLGEPTLLVDTRRRFLNTCVLSDIAPGHAPRGHALVATSVLGGDAEGREREVRGALREAYGTGTDGWDLLTVRTVADALPAMAPPQPLIRTSRVAPGRYACGDHRATGSVQGRWPREPARPGRCCATWGAERLPGAPETPRRPHPSGA